MRDSCYCSSKREKALLCVFLIQNNFRIILISFFLALGTNLFPPLLGGGLLGSCSESSHLLFWLSFFFFSFSFPSSFGRLRCRRLFDLISTSIRYLIISIFNLLLFSDLSSFDVITIFYSLSFHLH